VKGAMLAVVAVVLSFSAAANPVRLAQAFSPNSLPPREVVAVVRAAGLVPISPPRLAGRTYELQAVDRRGMPLRVFVDAEFGDIVAVRRMGDDLRPPGMIPGPHRELPLPPAADDDQLDDFSDRPVARPRLPTPHRPLPERSLGTVQPKPVPPPSRSAKRPDTVPPAAAAPMDKHKPNAEAVAPADAAKPQTQRAAPADEAKSKSLAAAPADAQPSKTERMPLPPVTPLQ
jgi:hypothetical protein